MLREITKKGGEFQARPAGAPPGISCVVVPTSVNDSRTGTQHHTPPAQTPADPDKALREWLHRFAGKHPRRDYHRAHGGGRCVNRKKTQHL